jgi:hypothetical protein
MLFSKLKFNLSKKIFLISIGGFFSLIFIITFFMAYSISPGQEFYFDNFHTASFVFMLFAGTIFLAGRSYYDMNTPEKSLTQIMVPASTFEKFIIPAIATSLGWLIVSFLSYEVFAAFVNIVWSGLFGLSIELFNIFDLINNERLFEFSKGYLMVHSVFFLGATAFKKYPIAKTLLTGFLINVAFTFFTFLLIIIFFGTFNEFGHNFDNNFRSHFFENYFSIDFVKNLSKTVELIFTILIPSAIYIAAFFKLKEREV